MLPWNSNRNLVVVRDRFFFVDRDGRVYQLDHNKIQAWNAEPQAGQNIAAYCYPLAGIDKPVEHISRGTRDELLCLTAYPSSCLFIVDVDDDCILDENRSYKYQFRQLEVPVDESGKLYLPMILGLRPQRFLVVVCELPTENGRDFLLNKVTVFGTGYKTRTLVLPSEKTPAEPFSGTPPLAWDSQIEEMITHGVIVKPGGASATCVALLMYRSGAVVFVAITPANKLVTLAALSVGRRPLNGLVQVGANSVLVFGNFSHLIELKF